MANNCKIIGNNFVNNSGEIGVGVEGSTGHVIAGNNITGAGISVASTNTIITANNITGGTTGVHIGMSRDVTLCGNTISHNKIGVILEWWGPYNIYENNITDNQECGILFREGISNTTIRDNRIEQNNIGIKLTNYNMSGDAAISSGNTVVHNNIIDNTQQVFVERTWEFAANFEEVTYVNGTATVSWDNGKFGNYWSNYLTEYPNAVEVDASNIGDTPYVIDENNIDN